MKIRRILFALILFTLAVVAYVVTIAALVISSPFITIAQYATDAAKDFFAVVRLICEVASTTPGFGSGFGHMVLTKKADWYSMPHIDGFEFKWSYLDYDHVCSYYSNRPEGCDDILDVCKDGKLDPETYYKTHNWRQAGWIRVKSQADSTRRRAEYFLKCLNSRLDQVREEQRSRVCDYELASRSTYISVL